MLGMFLVVAIMALLLGGTLYGLADYRTAMGVCQSKLDELQRADALNQKVLQLRRLPSDRCFQALYVEKQIKPITDALDEYAVQLEDSIERKRAFRDGEQEKAYIDHLHADL